jgi:hypothetical protein
MGKLFFSREEYCTGSLSAIPIIFLEQSLYDVELPSQGAKPKALVTD